MKVELTKELLTKLYLEENKSSGTIAKELNYGKTWIVKKLREFELTSQKTIKQRNKGKFDKIAQTNLEKYGSISPFGNREIQEKAAKTILKKYGVDHPTRSKEIREKIQQTCKEKYGSITPFGNKEIQKKIASQYSLGTPQQKCNETKHKNNSFNTSEDEEQIYKLLIEKFGPDNIIRQYKSELYPYPCDFYIKSLDLYIEYQGSWVHGQQAYDPSNTIHQKLLEKWKSKETEYFNYAIKIWSQRDPEKRKIAKENNLNWKEFFNLEELEEWILQKNN